ncbi:hypothetical protein TOPH_02967 [Tolypocladium ophioglossoides CBS 100239]|uniref:Uncharacterized protein n=1 Tax=Tolypocladium ophioglossoides (strain CBS 100239) TaxID=1163406 RepID=A0A0L0NEH5_TOLOC|nr:hypothetical protein TOPH_02967 [Tolypocladium ophioglossoides CBS 100239]
MPQALRLRNPRLLPDRALGQPRKQRATRTVIYKRSAAQEPRNLTMPRRRPAQPSTPENLPAVPAGAYKKEYYSSPDTVYYLKYTTDTEWSRGYIHEATTSTTLHYVVDEFEYQTYPVYAQYIRKRADWD